MQNLPIFNVFSYLLPVENTSYNPHKINIRFLYFNSIKEFCVNKGLTQYQGVHMKGFIFSILIFFGQFSHAALSWPGLLDLVVTQGTVGEFQGGEYRFLKNIIPNDESKAHTASYVTAQGAKDSDGKFQTYKVNIIQETWVPLPNDGWSIDQWIINFTPEGQFIEVFHTKLTRDRESKITYEIPKEPASQQQAIDVFKSVVAPWVK